MVAIPMLEESLVNESVKVQQFNDTLLFHMITQIASQLVTYLTCLLLELSHNSINHMILVYTEYHFQWICQFLCLISAARQPCVYQQLGSFVQKIVKFFHAPLITPCMLIISTIAIYLSAIVIAIAITPSVINL